MQSELRFGEKSANMSLITEVDSIFKSTGRTYPGSSAELRKDVTMLRPG